MRLFSRFSLFFGFLAVLVSSCHHHGRLNRGGGGASTVVSLVTVTSTRESPASVSFSLADAEADPANVQLVFFELGMATPTNLTLQGAPLLTSLATDPTGAMYTFQWEFDTDVGTGFQEGFEVRVNIVDGVQSILSTAVASNLALGNDAPDVLSITPSGGPATGNASIPFRIADTSDDVVNVIVEYDIVGDSPDQGFRLARPAGLSAAVATPGFAFTGVTALRAGVDLNFKWDVVFDEGQTDFQALIRITAEDDLLQGPPLTSSALILDNNASAMIVNLTVTDARQSPATVSFRLLDGESDPQRVQLQFRRPGTANLEPMSLVVPGSDTNLGSAPAGTDHILLWDFATDLGGSGFLQGLSARGEVLEGSAVVSTFDSSSFDVGNDAPRVTDIFMSPGIEVTGPFSFSIEVADSSGDDVNVAFEYDLIADVPDVGFQSARPAGLASGTPTPEFAVTGLMADPLGTNVAFTWDVPEDEGTTEFSAVLQFRVADDLVEGLPVSATPVAFDNNASPRAEILGTMILSNTDTRRGMPIPFSVFDDEGDTAGFILQWREANGTFPTLPTDVSELKTALSDNAQRRQLQIAAEYRALYEGRAKVLEASLNPNGDRVGLPELQASAAGALATGVIGDQLELLRDPVVPAATGNAWSLAQPIAVLAINSGPNVLILDSDVVGTWRLREMDITTGAEVRVVSGGSEGSPFAMDYQRGSAGRIVLAVGDGSAWSVLDVDVADGMVIELLPASSAPVTGDVRAIKSLHANAAVLTVDDALVRVDFPAGASAKATPVLRGLGQPWGLAVHPTLAEHVFVANAAPSMGSASSGVLDVDLSTSTVTHVTQAELREPRSIALSPDGTQLAAITDENSADGTFELSILTLGGPDGVAVTELMTGLTDELTSVELGGDGLTVLALPDQNDLAIASGVEQSRRIIDFTANRSAVTVDSPFDPAITTNVRWRLRENFDALEGTLSGTSGVYVWDSSEFTSGGDVVLRGVALDTDVGTDGQEFSLPQPISAPLDVQPISCAPLAGSPVLDFVAADLDGDGDVDLASISGGDSFAIATQDPLGEFVVGQSALLEAGASATAIVAGDTDGDGLIDLAVGDGNGAIFVFKQDMAGVFGPAPQKLTTASVTSLELADFNRDGRADLIATHSGADKVSVFFGTATVFNSVADREFTDSISSPVHARAADLSGDGLPDLVVANNLSGAVTVYFQTSGSGLNATADRVLSGPGGGEPTSVALADLDRDGNRDVLVSYAGIDKVGVFLQDSMGMFALGSDLIGDSASIADPFEIVVSDLDGDGDGDLAVSSEIVPAIAVFLRAADGSFPAQPELSLAMPSDVEGALGLAAVDVDGDGRTDIAAARGAALRLDLFLQARPGDFRSASLLLTGSGVSERAQFIQPGDYDGDGDLDLALANRRDNHVSLYIQKSPGVFEPSDKGVIGAVDFDGVTALATGDLDGDGDLDLVGVLTGASHLGVAFQDAPGEFSFDASTGILGSFRTVFRPRSVAIGDLNDDGKLDIVSANTGGGDLSVFLQGAAGVFPQSPSFNLSDSSFTLRPNVVLALDLDGDGDTDLAVATRGSVSNLSTSGVSIFLQNAGSFSASPDLSVSSLLPGSKMLDITAIDIDRDGDLDLVGADRGAGALVVFEQSTPGMFAFVGPPLTVADTTISPISIEAADFNGDGLNDVAAVDSLSNTILVFLQYAPGLFRHDPQVALAPLASNGVTLSIAAADFDSDGDVDIVSADSKGGEHTVHFGGR